MESTNLNELNEKIRRLQDELGDVQMELVRHYPDATSVARKNIAFASSLLTIARCNIRDRSKEQP